MEMKKGKIREDWGAKKRKRRKGWRKERRDAEGLLNGAGGSVGDIVLGRGGTGLEGREQRSEKGIT